MEISSIDKPMVHRFRRIKRASSHVMIGSLDLFLFSVKKVENDKNEEKKNEYPCNNA